MKNLLNSPALKPQKKVLRHSSPPKPCKTLSPRFASSANDIFIKVTKHPTPKASDVKFFFIAYRQILEIVLIRLSSHVLTYGSPSRPSKPLTPKFSSSATEKRKKTY